MKRPLLIRTARLRLVGADAALARAAAEGPGPLGEMLGARVPASWPPEDLVDALGFVAAHLEREPAAEEWPPLWFILVDAPMAADRLLVGAVGFKWPPREDGAVEIGYGVVPDAEGRGYTTEAVGGLVRWAFSHAGVERVLAHTFERHLGSRAVLRKNGFVLAGAGTEPVDENDRRGRGELLLFELRREDWERSGQAPPSGARVVGVHHVQVTIGPGEEERARAFYVGVLGLREVGRPAALRGEGGLWLAAGEIRVHIGVEEGADRRGSGAHVAYAVTDLAAYRERLAAAGVEVVEGAPIPGYERLEFRDPFGNRVELIRAL